MSERVIYVDYFNYFYSQLQVDKSMDENGEPLGGFIGSLNQIQRLVHKFGPKRVIIVLDGPEAGLRRRNAFPDYKGRKARKKHIPKVDVGDAPIEVDNEELQLRFAYEFLRKLPVTVVVVPYYEADDIIAHLVKKNPEYENIICSSDKDYLQLVNENTSVWAWGKKTLFTPVEVVEHYNVMPENFAYFRSVIGDPSDKLPGVEGIGDITMLKLLPQLATKKFEDFEIFWKTIMDLQPETITETKARNLLGVLKEQKDTASLMYKLMKLDENTLKLGAVAQLNQQLDAQLIPRFNSLELKLYCIKQNLEPHFKYFDLWVRPFVPIKKAIPLTA